MDKQIKQQDLISLAFIHDINKINKQLNNIMQSNKIVLFSSNLARFKNDDESNTLYNTIRQNMFAHKEAIAYFINRIEKTTLSDIIYSVNKQYYIGITTSFYITTNIDIKDNNDDFKQYCKAFFIPIISPSWNNLIHTLKAKFPNDTTLQEILKNIDPKTLSDILEAFKNDFLKDVENLQDSAYFTHNILPLVKPNIINILDKVKTNIQTSQNEQYIKKITRTIAIALISCVDIDIKHIIKSGGKKFLMLLNSFYTTTNEVMDMIESSKMVTHYALATSLMDFFFNQIASAVTLYNKQFMNELLFYDDNFIDFGIYKDMIETNLPIQSTFITGKVKQSFVKELPPILKKEQEYSNISEYSIININDKHYNLEWHVLRQIQDLRFFFFAEYTDLNSANFIEIMKHKAYQEQNASSHKEKAYLFITEAPRVLNAALTKDIIEIIGLTPSGYEKYQIQQQALKNKHNPAIDYSNYIITQNTEEFKHIVLQLSPFVKLPNDLATEYKKYEEKWDISKRINTFTNKSLSQQFQYIQSFFQTPSDIEEIIEKEAEFAKDFLQLLQDFFDSINTNKAYSTKQASSKILQENTQYDLKDMLAIIITLCILHNEFESVEPFYGYTTTSSSFLKSIFSEIEWMQTYTIPSYGYLYILTKHAYVMIDDIKVYMFLSKAAQDNADLSNIQFLRVDTLVYEILERNHEIQDEFYTNAFNIFTKDITTLLNKEQQEELKKLHQQEKEAINELAKNANQQELAMIHNQINKISIQNIIETGIKSYIPFIGYFDENPDFMGKIVNYCAKCIFDKEFRSLPLTQKFTHILAKELGVMAILKIDKKMTINEVTEIYKLYRILITKRMEFMYYAVTMSVKTRKIITLQTLKLLSNADLKNLLKDSTKGAITAMAQGFLTSWVKQQFPIYAEEFKTKYEYIYYKQFRYKYNLPYALNRPEFVTIPMKIYNAYMGFDLHAMIYGSKLCSGGLKYHSGIAYTYTPQSSVRNTAITKDYMLQKILGYLLLEELRGVRKTTSYPINDIDFFANGFNKASIEILRSNKELYKLRDINKLKEFRKLEGDSRSIKAIDAYNACIDILHDLSHDILNTRKSDNTYESKTKKLLEYLKIIGQNNIKALYVGTSKMSVNKKRPKLIGRLATTIIIEDGLWLG